MTAADILADLVRFPSLPGTPNGAVTGYIRDYLAGLGVESVLIPLPEGDRFNLFATIGPRDRRGYILSGHSDVVSAEGQVWSSDPFSLTREGERLTGRGTTDMKGFLAACLAIVPQLLEMPLKNPIHLAFSCDEEIGCRGVGPMIAALPRLCLPPLGAIIGEPSNLTPVLAHKGKRALALEFEGVAGHSSQPGKGLNALYPAAELLLFIEALNQKMAEEGPFDPRFDPPHSTCQAGTVKGGAAVNIIAERARIEFELRSIPGASPAALSQPVLDKLAAIAAARGGALKTRWEELSTYPALPPCEDEGFIALMERLSGKPALEAVSYGTEAGLYHAAGIPSIICGPGDIARAHRPDEFILESELAACTQLLLGLAHTLCD